MKITAAWLAEDHTYVELPLYLARISAGFPSPGADYVDKKLDLNELVIWHKNASYYVQAEGDSMKDIGILDGAILVVDCSIKPENNDIVVAALNGDLLVKKYHMTKDGKIYLLAENKDYPPILVDKEMRFEIWGVVTWGLNQYKYRRTTRFP